jgi:hypothetical protein
VGCGHVCDIYCWSLCGCISAGLECAEELWPRAEEGHCDCGKGFKQDSRIQAGKMLVISTRLATKFEVRKCKVLADFRWLIDHD